MEHDTILEIPSKLAPIEYVVLLFNYNNHKHDDEVEDNRSTLKAENLKIETRPFYYLGIDKDCYSLVKICAKSGIIKEIVLLTLKKRGLNDSYIRLGDDYGITEKTAQKVILK